MVIISVAGSKSGVGVTHLCLSLATAIKQKCEPESKIPLSVIPKKNRCRIAVLGNDSSYIDMGIELGRLDEESDNDSYDYKGITYVTKSRPLSVFRKENVDFLIIDCGQDIEKLSSATYPILVSGSRPWNMASEEVYSSFETADNMLGLENIIMVFPFADNKAQKEIRKNLAENSLTLFPSFDANPLEETSLDISFIKEAEKDMDIHHEQEMEEIRDKYSNKLALLEEEIKKKEEEIRARETEIEKRKAEATTDILTGCKNRLAFEKDFEGGVFECVIVFDINDLKTVNDTYGHEMGDELIKAVSGEIKNLFPRLYRVGGDEFYALCESASNVKNNLAKLDELVAKHVFGEQSASVSFGFALLDEADTKRDALSLADSRMYENKQAKKPEKIELSEDLVKLLEDEEKLKAMMEEKEKLLAEKNKNLAALEAKIEENEGREEELTKIVEESLAEYSEDCIPFAPFEPDEAETEKYKLFGSMWFDRMEVTFERHGEYSEFRAYVFPQRFVRPPYRLPLAVVFEEKGEYSIITGLTARHKIGKCEIAISANFTKDGEFNVSLMCDEDTNITSKNEKLHKGSFTPKHFGKLISLDTEKGVLDYELFPLRKNLNNTYDCLLTQTEIVTNEAGEEEYVTTGYVSNGLLNTTEGMRTVFCDDKKLMLMPV